jgi:hypothetical protein
MYNIASIDSKGNKQYLIQMDGKKMEWVCKVAAQHQLECLNRSVSCLGTEGNPKNIKWVIEECTQTR